MGQHLDATSSTTKHNYAYRSYATDDRLQVGRRYRTGGSRYPGSYNECVKSSRPQQEKETSPNRQMVCRDSRHRKLILVDP